MALCVCIRDLALGSTLLGSQLCVCIRDLALVFLLLSYIIICSGFILAGSSYSLGLLRYIL